MQRACFFGKTLSFPGTNVVLRNSPGASASANQGLLCNWRLVHSSRDASAEKVEWRDTNGLVQ